MVPFQYFCVFIFLKLKTYSLPLRLSPDGSDSGSIPACGPLLHVLPSISHAFLSISLYNKAQKNTYPCPFGPQDESMLKSRALIVR